MYPAFKNAYMIYPNLLEQDATAAQKSTLGIMEKIVYLNGYHPFVGAQRLQMFSTNPELKTAIRQAFSWEFKKKYSNIMSVEIESRFKFSNIFDTYLPDLKLIPDGMWYANYLKVHLNGESDEEISSP